MSSVWKHSTASGGSLLVLLAIADFADDNGVAWPAVDTLAIKARLTRRQVLRIIRSLEARGELEVRRGGGRGRVNHYRVKRGNIVTLTELNGDIHDQETVTPMSPEPSVEPPKKERLLSKNGTDPDLALVYAHWRTRCGKTRPGYDQVSQERARKIQARLSDGFTAAELCRAINAVAADDWPERRKHNDLTVIFRSREKVDGWLERGRVDEGPRYRSMSEAMAADDAL